jgi:hypothetical protein
MKGVTGVHRMGVHRLRGVVFIVVSLAALGWHFYRQMAGEPRAPEPTPAVEITCGREPSGGQGMP